MQLLVIRHARAVSVKEFAKTGEDDDLRPLTGDGEERMRMGVAGLHRLVDELDVLATSPLVRARQTAEIVAAEYDGPAIVELDELRPGSPASHFVEWVQDAGSQETIAIVGHEKQLERLVGLILTGIAEPIARIKKGGAVMLELGGGRKRHAGLRSGELLWSLTPRQLRMLGEEAISRDSG